MTARTAPTETGTDTVPTAGNGVAGVRTRNSPQKGTAPLSVPVLGPDGHYLSPSGMRVMRTKLVPTRMKRLLHLIGLTGTKFGDWVGRPLPRWIAENPRWTERDWYDLVCENYEGIKAQTAGAE